MTSIRRQLVVQIAVGTLVVILFAGATVFMVARTMFQRQLDETLIARARTLAALVIEERPEPDEHKHGGLTLDYKGSLAQSDLGVAVNIVADDGTVIARSPDWDDDYTAVARAIAADTTQTNPTSPHLANAGDGRLLTYRYTALSEVPNDDTRLVDSPHQITIMIFASHDSIGRAQAAVVAALFVGGILAMFGAIVVTWRGVNRGLRPIDQLCATLDTVDARTTHDFGATGDYPRELQPIIATLEDVFARIRAAMAREERLTDAAAYELRTPIAELRLLADVALRFPESDRLLACVGDVSAIADELTSLLDVLLASARGTELDEASYDSIALLPIARTQIERRREVLDERRITCTVTGDPSGTWLAPRSAVTAILRNVIDNAVEYTPKDGSIAVHVDADCGIAIRNGPVSLTEDDVAHIFEPFWRSDAARKDRRHRGLGLTIIATMAQSLHIAVHASLHDTDTLSIELRPAPQPVAAV
ncbi:MAG: HAMP domain-containing histidine kinase [Phycisphaerales bacterium]|nr:HAMP domain-containing histidine kinase [Phycisphaerales bacterium]